MSIPSHLPHLYDPTHDDFETITDGPFTLLHSSWPSEYAPVTLQFPPSPLQGVLLFFHGAGSNGKTLFRLAEERAIVAHLMRLHFAAVAFTSQDKWGGWLARDFPYIQKSLTRLRFPAGIPILALGVSNGGLIVTQLPQIIPIHGIIVEISPGDRKGLSTLNVPTAFVYMAGDEWATKDVIENAMASLRGRGIATMAFEVQELEVTERSFAEKLPEFFNEETSKLIFNGLSEQRLIVENGKLTDDPSQTGIVEATMEIVKGIIGDEVMLLVTQNIKQLFNVAWGVHATTREGVPEALDFLIEQTKSRLN
jgi:hypothetical protein